MGWFRLLVVTLALASSWASAWAQGSGGPEVVYQSEPLGRTTGEPNVYRASFRPCDPDGRFRLVLDNGVDGGRRVSSGSVSLNGTAVILARDLNQQVSQLVRPVALASDNVLEMRLAGAPGGRVRITVDGYMNCLRVRITAPVSGAVLREPATIVEGEVDSRAAAGVRVRATVTLQGQAVDWPFPTEVNGRRFAAWVDLTPGPVQIVALASDATGREARDAVAVTFEPDPPSNTRAARPDVSPTLGFAPLAVTFDGSAASDPDVDRLDLDVDGDGRPDFGLADFATPPHRLTYTYRHEGLYVATLTVHDTSGLSTRSRVPINVIARPDVAAIWSAFRAALGRGDVAAALRFVADEARDRYRRVFEDLRADLPAIAAALGDPTPQVVRPGYATATAIRVRDGQTEAVLIHFIRDGDGVWRIASM